MSEKPSALRTVAILSAAGRGIRVGSVRNKVLLPLLGKPILAYALEALRAVPRLDGFVLVVRKEEREEILNQVVKKVLAGDPRPFWLCSGGETREDSMWSGLQTLPDSCETVLYHDGARPFLAPAVVEAALDRFFAGTEDGVVCAVPVKDTIKVVGKNDRVTATPIRAGLRAVQTPQIFRRQAIVHAYEVARDESIQTTDDAQILEIAGGKIAVTAGDYGNIKITTPEDLAYGEWLLRTQKKDAGAGHGRES
uniref:2-C-methyl-D-erythritol 4-phosphate cytidylyltransferase n=1 Tax=Ndongobacter massiliensis TaxID=1871025 RepID=UPI000931022D|nr:2-C-methyl-D-erythritol 4-phosphate cytidylyltransferase [Ndongobacter massiliensis]